MNYKHLFKKGQIGNLELKNRVVMSPMGTGYASSNGEASDGIIKYYEERAKGGVGLIITEIVRVDDITGVGLPNQLSVTNPANIQRLTYLADTIHKYDSKVFLQLHHPGRQTSSRLLPEGDVISASDITCSVTGEKPRPMTTEEVEEMAKKFIKGAAIAQTAGIDGVEIHAAHGYLINQFLSPHTNKRTDKYGGDFRNRARLLTEIIKGIQMVCGPDYPISVRISAEDYVEGGNTLEDTVKLSRYLESLGIACLNVSSGTYESGHTIIEPAQFEEGWKKHLSKTIKENVNIPVIAVNTIKHPEFAESLLEEEVSDFIALGRGLLTDPQWVNKAMMGNEKNIRKCVGCLYCFKTLNDGVPLACTVNPILGREFMFSEEYLNEDGKERSVAIIGGGPAGMQAAKILALRNFKPIIFEKDNKLGGTVNLAAIGSYKTLLDEFIQTQIDEIESLGVEVRLNTEATVDEIKKINPYGLVIARGGDDIVPPLKGIDKDNVYLYEDILLEKVTFDNKKVVVVGGGETGLETAEFLGENNNVQLIEMMPNYGVGMYSSVLSLLEARLAEKEVELITNTALEEVKDDGITVKNMTNNYHSHMDADAVVLALGVRTNKEFNDEFINNFDKVIRVGDADKPGNIAAALREANDKSFVF